MSTKFLSLFIIFLVAAHIVLAQEDFSVISKKAYTLCPCSNQGYPLLISNTGSTQSTYSLYVGEEVKEWVTVHPQTFTLDPGQATQVGVYVNAPCTLTTLLPIPVFITTSNGLTKGLSQIVQFTSCYDYSIYSGEPVLLGEAQQMVEFKNYEKTYSLCAEDQTIIPLLIQNKDASFNNQYTLQVRGEEWANIEPSTFDLGSKKSGVVILNANPSLANVGSHELIVTSTSKAGEKTKEKILNLDVAPCYGASLHFLEGKEAHCSGVVHQFVAELTNEGKFEETFFLSVEGASWTFLETKELTLKPGQKETVFLTIEPEDSASGNHEITLLAYVQAHQTTKAADTLSISLTPLDHCHNVVVDVPSDVKNDYNEQYIPVKIMNTGEHKTTYTFTFEGPSWITFDGSPVTLNPGQVHNFNLHVNPAENVQKGNYVTTLSVNSDYVAHSQEITINLEAKSKLERWIFDAAYQGRYYLFTLGLFLVLLIIFRKPLLKSWESMMKRRRQQKSRVEALKKARKERAKKVKVVVEVKPKKEKRRRKKKRSLHEKIGFFLVFLALLFGLSLIFYPTKVKSILEPYLASLVAGFVGVVALLVIFSLLYKGFKTVLHNFEK